MTLRIVRSSRGWRMSRVAWTGPGPTGAGSSSSPRATSARRERNSAATEAGIGVMRRALEDSLAAGAVGMSTGLFYRPANDAPPHPA